MRHAALLDRRRTVLVLIDLQEGYRAALHAWDRVVAASALLVRGAALLDLPLLVTEQYPRGLGHTAAEVANQFPAGLAVTEKMSMSCCSATPFASRLAETGRTQVLVAGIETHACVNQTVHDLVAAGMRCTSPGTPPPRAVRPTSVPRGRRCARPACCPRRASRRCSSSFRLPRRPSSRSCSGS